MNEQKIETEIIKSICQERKDNKSFEEIIAGFNKKLLDFNPIKNCFEIEQYFGTGKGKSTSLKLLTKDGRINKDWLREYETKKGNSKTDFKGLYIFIHENIPFYVGISKGVIGRLNQHVKGRNHNTSTLAFKIGRIRYKLIKGFEFTGERKDLNYESEVEPIKEFLMKQRVAFIHIDNDDELTLFEIYCSMKLGTWLNSFETH